MTPNLPGVQGTKICIQYISTHPNKPILNLLNNLNYKIPPELYEVGIGLKIKQPKIVWNYIKTQTMTRS